MLDALKRHWPEYAIEAVGLGLFMVSACVVTAILEHPASPLRQGFPDPLIRRLLIGITMGLTAMGIIYSPWGKRSGAHLNPSVTLTFFRLGKIDRWDALFYVASQFVGGLAGVLISAALLGNSIADKAVNYAVTVPGPAGPTAAFLSELVISLILMLVILMATNSQSLAPFTGLLAGALIASYVVLEAPISGMSMNPARTFGSALPAHRWTALWVYFTAPPLGMLFAAEAYARIKGVPQVICAKLNHTDSGRCIFRCGYAECAEQGSGNTDR